MFNNPRYARIILGPIAHKINNVSSSSLNNELLSIVYPYYVNLVNEIITKNLLMKATTKIKWNYFNNI